jgi:uncharacterized membrane protein YesL
MMVNSLLAILIILMIVRDLSLLIRHRRPFRLAYLVVWVLLACSLFTGRSALYPLILASLIAAVVMKRRELSVSARMLEGEAGKAKSSPSGMGLWDREMDGG